MDAVISGRAKTALLMQDDGSMQSFHANAPDVLIPRKPSDYHLLFNGASDLQFLENVEREETTQHLLELRDGEDALLMCLFVLDPEYTDEERRESALVLEDLLQKEHAANYLKAIMYSRPLPPSGDLKGALECCAGENLIKVRAYLNELETLQPHIEEVWKAWEQLPDDLFDPDKAYIQAVVVREGLFATLVRYLMKIDKHNDSINDVFMIMELSNSLRECNYQFMKKYNSFISSWIISLKKNRNEANKQKLAG